MISIINKYRYIITMLLFSLFLGSSVYAESTFSGERLKEALFNYIRNQHKEDVEITMLKEIDDFKFTNSEVIAKFTGNRKNLRGNCVIGIEFSANDVLLKRVEIPLKIRIYSHVPIASTQISKGKVISLNDVIFEKKDITVYNDNEFTSIDSIINKKAVLNISKGSVLTRRLITSDASINKGERVTVKSISGAVCVSVSGVALQDAQIGERLRVKTITESARNSQILEGIVSENNSVIIYK